MTHSPHIIIVDDEAPAREMVGDYLKMHGFTVTLCDGGKSLRGAIEVTVPDLVVLDLNMPEEDGLSIIRDLKSRTNVPVIMLTATASPIDRVVGLELGADDYVAKPFHFRELLLRIQNCLKRAQDLAQVPGEMRGQVRIGRALVDLERFLATVDGKSQALTHKECAVLRLLAERAGKAVSRDEILDRAWSPDEFPTSRTVDNFIVRLRKLIEEDAADPRVIRSIRGVGYLLTELHRA